MAEWKRTTLGEFISLQRGHDLPSRERQSGRIPVIGSGGITGYHDTAVVPGPGITIGRAANLGVPTLVHENYWPLNTTLYVTDFHGNDVRFTYYLLKTLDLTGFNSGSVQPMLNRNYIRDFPITVPGQPGQKIISRVLGALDDKIAVNHRIVSCALALGDAVFITAQAPTVSRCTLARLAAERALSFGDGYRTKRSEHGKPGLPILRVAEVMDGRIEPEFADYVAESYRSAMGNKISQAGDVILTSKGTVGRVATITAKDPLFVYSPQLCYFRVSADSRLSSSYIFFWLRSSDFWQQAESRKSQTDMADYLSLTDIRRLTIPVPDPGSHHQCSPTLDSLLAQISACHQENNALSELRDRLLPKLISGQIRVRDAEKVVEDVT
jgi:type I restriction enzyme S subunit